jgi:hypothetical protein
VSSVNFTCKGYVDEPDTVIGNKTVSSLIIREDRTIDTLACSCLAPWSAHEIVSNKFRAKNFEIQCMYDFA